MNSSEKKKQLLEKFFDDRCSRDDLEELLTHLQRDQEPEYAEVMQQAWDRLQHYPAMSQTDADRIFGSVMRKAGNEPKLDIEISQLESAKTVTFRLRWYQAAAAVTGLLMLSALVYQLIGNTGKIHRETAYGQTMQVTLPDHSVINLNGNSSISYEKDWNSQKVREVWLDGEAYFSVVHTANHQPFIVHANNKASIEVLGTQFTVSDREQATRVVLNSGSIRLKIQESQRQQQLLMKPGDMVELKKGQEKVLQKRVNPQLYSAWTEKRLIFDNTPLREVVADLENTYGLTVRVPDSTLLNRQVSGSTPISNVDVFLKGLSRSFNLQITRSGGTVDIRSIPEE